jgi:hypothetical protein
MSFECVDRWVDNWICDLEKQGLTRSCCPTTIGKFTLPGCQSSQEYYTVFHRFREAKFDNGGSILSWSQFLPLPQLPQKMKLTSKVVKIDSK